MTVPENSEAHPGGDKKFWRDEMVRKYERQQYLVSEKKEELLANMVRIINHFRKSQPVTAPEILDIGCGPGTATTLCKYVLEGVADSRVTGTDASEQMIEIANLNLASEYGDRFSGFVSDFNSDSFWIPGVDKKYDFITSSGALHYLSDNRMTVFLKEVYNNLKDGGVFVVALAARSDYSQILRMEDTFRIEFTYNQLGEGNRPPDFQTFRKRYEETDGKANINWHNHDYWLSAIEKAGFREADVVWQLWVRSVFVALK